jgi:hypothetical protein
VTTVKEHSRAKPYAKAKARMSERLAFRLLVEGIERELDKALAEPLDATQFNDLSRDDKQRMREV